MTKFGPIVFLVMFSCGCSSAAFIDIFKNDRHQKRTPLTKRTHSSSSPIPHRLSFRENISPPEIIAAMGETIKLKCDAGGNPSPTIHWLKDGVRKIQGNDYLITDEEPLYESNTNNLGVPLLKSSRVKSRLFLDCISAASEGQYTCVAETAYKRITTTIDVRVGNSIAENVDRSCIMKKSLMTKPARIYLWTKIRLELENSTIQLLCRAEGTAPIQITWYDRNNNLIVPEAPGFEDYRVLDNGDLVIRNIQWRKNIGKYSCQARNDYGSDVVGTFLYPTRL